MYPLFMKCFFLTNEWFGNVDFTALQICETSTSSPWQQPNSLTISAACLSRKHLCLVSPDYPVDVVQFIVHVGQHNRQQARRGAKVSFSHSIVCGFIHGAILER